ncbi:helix-turn-helix domain-containing protein [Streptomyces sp. AC495_CC817]|uniref:helix-turn-helix domain-containing protein n=1 Tax=Streptomyces sp. AC495_CC817 TaxID=2823900 RepID=UPI001C276F73|nr:helix-turn-helix domain-containing protein [Streptomyces sp. AC495_CC817]
MFDGERVYTLREAAERLHMPYRTLSAAIYSGRWPHRKISQRRRLMTESDIQAVLEEARVTPAAPAPASDTRSIRANVKGLISAA